uniref:Uncharacterized protein n=1 Tax=Melopsittacus undulatus TaxID=13146 RepID=A0A8V5GL01_MELUD
MVVTLGYWDIRGLAHAIRLLLQYTETPYEERQYRPGPGKGDAGWGGPHPHPPPCTPVHAGMGLLKRVPAGCSGHRCTWGYPASIVSQ